MINTTIVKMISMNFVGSVLDMGFQMYVKLALLALICKKKT